MRRAISLLLVTGILAGCAGTLTRDELAAQVLLLGEQHDADRHQRLHTRTVQQLVSRGTLQALVLEMADRGTSTAGLPTSADEGQVRAALRWQEAGWPWERYRGVVMTAVRAGVPVLGGNLPRERMRLAMGDAGFDQRLPAAALAEQQRDIRSGHCDMLPEAQIVPMARVQIARDVSMAQALAGAAAAGKTVVLVAGVQHVDAGKGVPVHLPASLTRAVVAWPAQPAAKDYCEEFRKQRHR